MFMVVTRVIDSIPMGYTLFAIGDSPNEDGHGAEEFGWVIDTNDGPHCYSTKYMGELTHENGDGELATSMTNTARKFVEDNRNLFWERGL